MNQYFIYKITSPVGKVYIGQTKNPDKRLFEYQWKSVNKQVLIGRSIKKYGYSNHIFEIFLDRYNKNQVDIEEIRLIKEYKNLGISLNIADGGYTSSSLRKRKVIKFDLLGNKLEEFNSVKEASESIKCTSDVIVKALKCNLYYAKGFLFIYKDDYDKGIIPTWSARNRGKSTIAKKLYQFDLEGKLLGEFSSSEEAAKKLGLFPTSISAVLRGELKKTKNFMFSYSNKMEKYNNKHRKNEKSKF